MDSFCVSFKKLWEMNPISILILQLMVKWQVQGLTASKEKSQFLNPGYDILISDTCS